MIGLIVIGGVAATVIKAPIALQYKAGDMVISIQEIFDNIMPNLMTLIIALISYFLVDKKGWTANKLLLGILGFAFVMVLLGVM